ncbi:AAA family ATPase, partial [Anaerofustis stercorihominis]|nr:AAA family ATPase [Anaerofustis stercorihominis]
FGKNIRTVILNKSYRNTREIADYAGKIANVKDIEFLDRHGKDVAERKFKTDEEMFEAVRANLKLEKEEKTDHTDDVV